MSSALLALLAGDMADSKSKIFMPQPLPPGLTVDEYKELMELNFELHEDFNRFDLKGLLVKVAIGTGLSIGAVWLWWMAEDSGKVPPLLHTLFRAIRQLGEGIKGLAGLPATVQEELTSYSGQIANSKVGSTAIQISDWVTGLFRK